MTPVQKIVVGALSLISVVVFLVFQQLKSENEVVLAVPNNVEEKVIVEENIPAVAQVEIDSNIVSIGETNDKNNIDNAVAVTGTSTKSEIGVKNVDSKKQSDSYQKIATTSSVSATTTAFYKEIIRKLINFEVTWEELEKQGVNDDDVFELADLQQDDLVSMIGYRKDPYLPATGYKMSGPKTSGEAEFLVIASSHEDVDLYMFSESGKFCGKIKFGEDGLSLLIEQVQGVSYYTYGDQGFMIDGGTGTTTMFINVKKPTVAQLYTRYGNGDIKPFYFPVSTQTKGSATILRTEKTISILNWNIDVDGDGTTDVSFGNEGPEQKVISKMIDIIIEDADLPEAERAIFREALVSGTINM